MNHTFKAPQGVLRTVILALASRSPITGTEIIEEVSRQTKEGWVPSPGSVYFLVNELKTEGLLMTTPGSTEKRYIATSKGEAEIQRTRAAFREGLMRNVQILSTLAGMIDPAQASRLNLLKAVLEAPEEKLREIYPHFRLTP